MTRAKWGEEVWGTGADEARALIGTRSAYKLRKIGLTITKARKLRDFYGAAARAGKGGGVNGTAGARAALMEDIIRTLGGKP